MAASADLIIRIITETKGAAGLDDATKRTGRLGSAMGKLALPAAAVGAAVFAFGKTAVDAASRSQQAMGGMDAVFGKNSKQMRQWAATAADSVGLSKASYAELATVTGAQLKNMGLPMDKVKGKTNDLIKMGADLSAQYGGSTKDAVEALGSALRGETDPIERYGVSIKQADIAAQQAKEGTSKLTGAAGKQAKTMALLHLMNQQTADSTGAFAREQDTAAHQAQVAAAHYDDMKATLGTALLPIMSKFAAVLAEVAKWVEKNSTLTMVIVGVIGLLAVAILAVNTAMGIYTAITTLAASATIAAWAAALWPILAVIAAVALVVIGIKLLWNHSKTFRTIVLAVWGAIKTAALATAGVLRGAVAGAWRILSAAGRAFGAAARAVFNSVRAVASAVASVIKRVLQVAFTGASLYVRVWMGVARAAFSAIRTAAGWVVDKVRSIGNWLRTLKVPGGVKTTLDAIKNVAQQAISKVQSLVNWLGNLRIPGTAVSAAQALHSAVSACVGAVQSLANLLANLHVPHLSFPSIPKIFSRAVVAPATTGFGTPALHTTGVGRNAATAGAPVVINVNGALDPEGVARQIQRLLANHDRRVGVRSVVAR